MVFGESLHNPLHGHLDFISFNSAVEREKVHIDEDSNRTPGI